jgi:hypothetical protein
VVPGRVTNGNTQWFRYFGDVRRFLLTAAGLLLAAPAAAQHEGHEGMDHEHMDHAHMHHGDAVSAPPDVVELELARNASGTAWQPETTPHQAVHTQAGGFDLMFHTLLFAGWDAQRGPRGAQQPIGIGLGDGHGAPALRRRQPARARDAEPRGVDRRLPRGRLPAAPANGRDLRRRAAARSPACARSFHGARRALHAGADERGGAPALRGARRASRPSGPSPSRTAGRRARIRSPLSRTTGRTRRTSASACSRRA